MEYYITDTHCHITCDMLYDQVETIIEHAKEHHIKRMLVVCTNFQEYERAMKLKEQETEIFDVALGFHPNDLYNFKEKDYQKLEMLLRDDKLIAVGEIGLDYHWDDVTKEDQIVGFRKQLELAKKYDKPVLIHMREATKDTVDVLKKYAPLKGIIHCYSGSYETAQELMKVGFYISYGGPLTFKNSRGAPEVAKSIPCDRLFVETDSPYLTPHPYRGKQNEPMYANVTFQKLCEIKEMDEKTLADQLEENYIKVFKK